MCGLFILIPDLQLVSLHGNSSLHILQGGCFPQTEKKKIKKEEKVDRENTSDVRNYYFGKGAIVTKLRWVLSHICVVKASFQLGKV